MSIEVFDNFLNLEDSQAIYNSLLDSNFPWYFNDGVAYGPEPELSFFQFTHMFFIDYNITSKYFNLIEPILKKIEPSALLRIKANLNPYSSERVTYPYHVDYNNFKGKTAIYYVNTNDGVTLFNDGTVVESIQNRFVIFDSNIFHRGTNCQNQKARSLINFNYYESLN